jgi:hypothetical protein
MRLFLKEPSPPSLVVARGVPRTTSAGTLFTGTSYLTPSRHPCWVCCSITTGKSLVVAYVVSVVIAVAVDDNDVVVDGVPVANGGSVPVNVSLYLLMVPFLQVLLT